MSIYKHHRTGNLYKIVGETKYKHQGKWYDAIIYKSNQDGRVWVRSVEDFKENFSKVE